MIELLRRNPLLAVLAAVCVGLAAIVAVELMTLGTTPSTVATKKGAPPEAKLLPPLAAASPEGAYPEIGARPLWIPTRRPAPPVVAATQQAFVKGQFLLQGVIMAGNTRIAMLKEKASGRIHRVELGRDVNGLHVAEVEPERVTLTLGGEREVIDLRVQRLQGTPGAPQQPVAAQPPQASGAVPTRNAADAAAAAARSGPFAPPPITPTPGGAPVPAAPANPVPGAVPQQSAAPMTPEELLARRRARRNQPTE
jgi:hypothetical protein